MQPIEKERVKSLISNYNKAKYKVEELKKHLIEELSTNKNWYTNNDAYVQVVTKIKRYETTISVLKAGINRLIPLELDVSDSDFDVESL